MKNLRFSLAKAYARNLGYVIASLLGIITLVVPPVVADTLQIFATVAAKPSDFQIVLNPPIDSSISQNTTINYSLTYGSYLATQTDMVALVVSWSRGQVATSPGSEVDIVNYIAGSGSSAYGGAAPQIDLANRTITWQISPMPPGANRSVSWQLRTTQAYEGNAEVEFVVSARLIGPGIEKQATPINMAYTYIPATVTPTPVVNVSPTLEPTIAPSPIASVSPTTAPVTPTPRVSRPSFTAPIIGRIEDIPIIGPPLKEGLDQAQDIAENDGAIVAAPIPIAVALVPALLNFIPLLGQVPWWQIPSLLAALLWSKRRRPWGVVYDSVTKQPLDPVLVTLTDAKGKAYQVLSDIYGRYQFLVEPGLYSLTAKKTNYAFPSTKLKNESTDGLYEDLYYGGTITITDEAAINYNIPMDPIALDWNQQKKAAMGLTNRFRIPKSFFTWVFWAGFGWSALMVVLAATTLNMVVLGFYGVLIGLRIIQRWRSPWGVIFDEHNKPLGSAAVSIIDLNNPLVRRPPVITKDSGRYTFLVDGGRYQLQVAAKKAYGYGAPVKGPVVTILGKQGTINKDLVVEQLNNEPNQPMSPPSITPDAGGMIINPNSRFNKLQK